MSDKSKLYTVSELAKEFAITARTIRHYEDEQLLSPQRVGNNRIFDYRDKARLSLILRLKNLGFMLKEIKKYMDLYNADETQVTQLRMGFSQISERIDQTEEEIQQLQFTLNELVELRNDVITRLKERGVDPDGMS